MHARTTNIRTLTHSNTHHMSSFYFFFSGERHGAMERHSSSSGGWGQTHRSPGGDGGGGRGPCRGYQGSSSSLALWVKRDEDMSVSLLLLLLLHLFSTQHRVSTVSSQQRGFLNRALTPPEPRAPMTHFAENHEIDRQTEKRGGGGGKQRERSPHSRA